MPNKAERRWLEIVKPYIVATAYAEVSAGRCMSMLIDAVPNNELRNGYHVQFVDEVRHTGLQMALARWYAKHTPDPSGWHLGAEDAVAQPGHAAGLQHAVRTSSWATRSSAPSPSRWWRRRRSRTWRSSRCPTSAARNGDFALPTTFLSVQSDEARHISNGYATLLTVLQEESNIPLIERDLLQAWWINHAYLDSFGSGIMEYTSKSRTDHESYLDKWDRWVRDDWYRSYVLKLGKLGLNLPEDMFVRARERIAERHGPQDPPGRRRLLDVQLLAQRPAGRTRLRVVRGPLPGLVRRVRRVLGDPGQGRQGPARPTAPSSSRSPSTARRRAGPAS